MWVRTQLKITYPELAMGWMRGLAPINRETELARAEAYFGASGKSVASYSVRSGFDLLLQSLNLKPGDEIVFSALNVRAMIKVVNNLGLVPVPVDVDLKTMLPKMDSLAAAITGKSRVFVAAHLFGTRLNLEPSFAYAKSKGLITVEDCAQAFNGQEYGGHPLADVVMYSFGPIKTATALGGALLVVRDEALLSTMRGIQDQYPIQNNRKQRKRALKFIGLKLATSPVILGSIYRYYKSRGRDYEDALADKVRDVAPLKTVQNMRIRPSGLMLWMINRRIWRFDTSTIERRAQKGTLLSKLAGEKVVLPGQGNTHHDYWVFPVLSGRPKELIKALRERGFDAADLPRSQHIAAPSDRPELEPEEAASLMRRIVVVPCYEAMPDGEIHRLAKALTELETAGARVT
jgi:perosamine synthetase